MELSPQQRDQLARLLEAELGALHDAATEAGADPETLAGTVESRRRALDADAPGRPAEEPRQG